MWSHKTIFMLCLLIVAIGQPASARTWRPSGQPALKGEFEDVVGNNVLIRTDDGVKTVAYADLSPTDKAVVKSKLVALDRETQALLLDRGPANIGESISSPGSALPGQTDPAPGGGKNDDRSRTWTDIAGNRIVAEFAGVQGTIVLLRSNGNVQQYPIKGFCAADQAWIAEHQTQAVPNTPPGFPSHAPPKIPPIVTPMPPEILLPPSMDRPHDGKGGFGSIPTPPGGGSGNNFPSGGIPPMHGPQFVPHAPPHPSSGIGQHSGFGAEMIYRCEHCGAEFAHDSGVKEGDACPKCSGGSSYSGSWARSIRFSRGLVRLTVLLVVLAGTGTVWLVRKLSGS